MMSLVFKVVSISFLCSIFNPYFSQTEGSKIGVLLGIVQDDSTNLPIEFASIRLISKKDSSIIGRIFTDVKGEFYLDQLPLGNFFLKITASGFNTRNDIDVILSSGKERRDLGILNLESNSKEIDVVIEASTEPYKATFEKKSYDVAKDPATKGGSLTDVLLNIPSISIDQEGRITLRGEGNVVVLVNGKPSVFGSNGSAALSSIPASSIERVEIVTNPSAKYDPDGTSGFINIVLKKSQLKGINGQIAATLATGNLYNASASLNVRNKYINAYGNYSLRWYEGFRSTNGTLEQFFQDSSIQLDQNRVGSDVNVNHVGRMGMDIYAGKRSTFGISTTLTKGDRDRYGDMTNELYDGNGQLLRKWNRIALDPDQNAGAELNLNYKYELSKNKGEFLIDFNTSQANNNTQGDYKQFDNLNGILNPVPFTDQLLNNKDKSKIYLASTDYVRRFSDVRTLESGFKFVGRDQRQSTNQSNFNPSTGIYDTDLGNSFEYKYSDRVFAGYSLWKDKYKKLTYSAGLRLEYAEINPILLNDPRNYRKSYFNFFPSLGGSYEVKKGFEITFNYGKRVNRPNSSDLNPFTVLSDQYNLRFGNPDLRPEFAQSVDVGTIFTNKKITFTTNMYGRYTRDLIQRVKLFLPNGTSGITSANINSGQVLGLDVVCNIKIKPWLKVNTSANASVSNYVNKVDSAGYDWSRTGGTFGTKVGLVFSLFKNTTNLTVNGRYNNPIVTAQGIFWQRGAVDITIDRSFLKNTLQISMKVGDVLKTQGTEFDVNQPLARQHAEYTQLTRRFFITVSYKFGKIELIDSKKILKQAADSGGDF